MTYQRSVTAQQLAEVVDSATAVPALRRMGHVAEGYARLGLRVFPLHHPLDGGCSCGKQSCPYPGKHPRTRRGHRDGTSNIECIRAWWFSHPYSNVGLATGHMVDVIDIDSDAAATTLADLMSARRVPEVLGRVTTGRAGGGYHLYISATGAPSTNNVIAGLDFKARGGYVVAAPSLHATGTRYAWTDRPRRTGSVIAQPSFGRLPWEGVSPVPESQGTRHVAYARVMLARQVAKVEAAQQGQRKNRVLAAAVNLGAVTAAGWVDERTVSESLFAAYRSAGGTSDDAVVRGIVSGLELGRTHPLPDLGEPLLGGDARDVVRAIRTWLDSPDFVLWKASNPTRKRLTQPRLQVLRSILRLAEESGQTSVPVSIRQAQLLGGLQSSGSGTEALKALCELPVMSQDIDRHRGPAAANRFRLHFPPGYLSICDATEQDTVGVPEVSTTPCSVASQRSRAATHSLWGNARGPGRGLTHNDRVLFACIDPDADAPVKTAEWAAKAGCARESLTRACGSGEDSLVSLGLVTQMGRGSVALTPLGAALASAVQGLTDSLVLDDLADTLGVATREELRERRVAHERKLHRRRLVLGRRTPDGKGPWEGLVERLLGGWLASERTPVLIAEVLRSESAEATSRTCGALDLTRDAQPVREALKRVLWSIEGWSGSPVEPLTEQLFIERVRVWLFDGACDEATDVHTELVVLLGAWWRETHLEPLDAPMYADGRTHAETVAHARIAGLMKVSRHGGPAPGYVAVRGKAATTLAA